MYQFFLDYSTLLYFNIMSTSVVDTRANKLSWLQSLQILEKIVTNDNTSNNNIDPCALVNYLNIIAKEYSQAKGFIALVSFIAISCILYSVILI